MRLLCWHQNSDTHPHYSFLANINTPHAPMILLSSAAALNSSSVNLQQCSLGMPQRFECCWAGTWSPQAVAQAWQHAGSWGQNDAPLLGSQEAGSGFQGCPGWQGLAQGWCYTAHCQDTEKYIWLTNEILYFVCLRKKSFKWLENTTTFAVPKC